MPLAGRTTVTPDLKGCLEEVSQNLRSGQGPDRSDMITQKEPAEVTATGRGPLKGHTQFPGPHATNRMNQRSRQRPFKGAREINA